MSLFEELKWRGLIKDVTDLEIADLLDKESIAFYIGTDPTADSLHIGHLSSMMMALRLKNAGHHPYILVGGGTGFIGDPRETSERAMISKEELNSNYEALSKQIKRLFSCDMVNNYDWYKDINFIDYLRDYGKLFNVSYMLAKDTVKSRLEGGISYTEFSYMILQSIDFLHLYENNNCILQVGGQDQWGNITAGVELIRKVHPEAKVYGFTMPLITKADGTKFGKSEGGAIWLDRNKTSSYQMYQFLINAEDTKVIDYLKMLTLLSKEEIEDIEKEFLKAPHERYAHKVLAKEVITFLHGEEAFDSATRISRALFSNDIKSLSDDEIEEAFKDVPSFTISEDCKLIDLLVDNKICSSRREVREFLNSGSITVDGEKVNDENFIISVDKKYTVIRRGKKKYYLIKKQD